ncbi:MAG: hypothetical protein KIS96_14490 [Bauldia sp.]|nr:hypothetical protein [Bauldia sp.]
MCGEVCARRSSIVASARSRSGVLSVEERDVVFWLTGKILLGKGTIVLFDRAFQRGDGVGFVVDQLGGARQHRVVDAAVEAERVDRRVDFLEQPPVLVAGPAACLEGLPLRCRVAVDARGKHRLARRLLAQQPQEIVGRRARHRRLRVAVEPVEITGLGRRLARIVQAAAVAGAWRQPLGHADAGQRPGLVGDAAAGAQKIGQRQRPARRPAERLVGGDEAVDRRLPGDRVGVAVDDAHGLRGRPLGAGRVGAGRRRTEGGAVEHFLFGGDLGRAQHGRVGLDAERGGQIRHVARLRPALGDARHHLRRRRRPPQRSKHLGAALQQAAEAAAEQCSQPHLLQGRR